MFSSFIATFFENIMISKNIMISMFIPNPMYVRYFKCPSFEIMSKFVMNPIVPSKQATN